MEFRIGVNLGNVMVDGEQIYGDGVNVAARLESLADPGGICNSGTAHDQVRDKLPLGFEDRGEQTVKNITRPVRVWRVVLNGTAAAPRARRRIARRYWDAGIFSIAGLTITLGTIVIMQTRNGMRAHRHSVCQRPRLQPPHCSLILPDHVKFDPAIEGIFGLPLGDCLPAPRSISGSDCCFQARRYR
jgi:Adenylate and Guanylate cyclase catalytic domain